MSSSDTGPILRMSMFVITLSGRTATQLHTIKDKRYFIYAFAAVKPDIFFIETMRFLRMDFFCIFLYIRAIIAKDIKNGEVI